MATKAEKAVIPAPRTVTGNKARQLEQTAVKLEPMFARWFVNGGSQADLLRLVRQSYQDSL